MKIIFQIVNFKTKETLPGEYGTYPEADKVMETLPAGKYQIEKIYSIPAKPETKPEIKTVEELNDMDPVAMFRYVENEQAKRANELKDCGHVNVLFNKCRYFEATLPLSIIKKIAKECDCKIKFETMIVDGKGKLDHFVRALNENNIYAHLTMDWI